MIQQLKAVFREESIDAFGILPVEEVDIIRPSLQPEYAKSVILMGVPYRDGTEFRDGVSAYAHVADYHKYFEELFSRIIPKLEKLFPGKRFCGFADHSPIAEKKAAAKAGLGIIGKHSLLIHPAYGSYLFLGEIVTDLELPHQIFPIDSCTSCGACINACPVNAIGEAGIDPTKCLSALSQKKRLTEEEKTLLKRHGIAWGCDICQDCCPYNKTRTITPIPYFAKHLHGDFSAKEVEEMDEETFGSFAFSWRGRGRICENLYNFEKLEKLDEKSNKGT